MPKGQYFQLRHLTHNSEGDEIDRRIWTFEDETDANDALEFFLTKGATVNELYVQEIETK